MKNEGGDVPPNRFAFLFYVGFVYKVDVFLL